MYELALFAGAGGGILGGVLNGWRCVGAVECEGYCRGVLAARQNDGCLHPFPIWTDVRSFTKRNNAVRRYIRWLRSIRHGLCISGGFPCQDISTAGKGAGIDGERSGLWREFARIIREVGPRCVLVENSPALTSRGLGRVLGDLAALGYDVEWGVLGAVHAGAPHKRERIWIVAHANPFRGEAGTADQEGGKEGQAAESFDCSGAVANASGGRCGGPGGREDEQPRGTEAECAGEAFPHADSGRSHAEQECLSRGTGETIIAGHGEGQSVAHASRILERRQEQRAERERAGAGGEPVHSADTHGLDADDGGHGAGSLCGEQRGQSSGVQECGDGPDSCGDGLERLEQGGAEERSVNGPCAGSDFTWWLTEPDVGRVAHGVAARVDRLRALGNGQVPAVVRLAWGLLGAGGVSEAGDGD